MKKMAAFLKTTLLGGFIVLLPVVLTLFLIRWLVTLITQSIEPLTLVFTEHTRLGHALALSFALVGVISLCFVLGLVVKTRLGHSLLSFVERNILKVAPGYSFFKETVGQLLGQKSRPFSRVVLVRMFGSSTLGTGFVTNEHAQSGLVTVFVPSGLNPTSGLLLHLPPGELIYTNVSVEAAMRTIIGCGTGASLLLDQMVPADAVDSTEG